MFWIVVVIGIFVMIHIGLKDQEKQKLIDVETGQIGYNVSQKITTGKYISGHPDIDSEIVSSIIYAIEGRLDILSEVPLKVPNNLGHIPISAINNILIEDKTTVQSRVAISRLLTVGLFALAWKKEDVNNVAYLIIEWEDQRFAHETIFEFTDKNATEKANTARNGLIKHSS